VPKMGNELEPHLCKEYSHPERVLEHTNPAKVTSQCCHSSWDRWNAKASWYLPPECHFAGGWGLENLWTPSVIMCRTYCVPSTVNSERERERKEMKGTEKGKWNRERHEGRWRLHWTL